MPRNIFRLCSLKPSVSVATVRSLESPTMRAAVFLLVHCASTPVWAQREPTVAVRREAEAHTRPCVASDPDALQRCEQMRMEFVLEYLRARAGEYLGQRNVADRLVGLGEADAAAASSGIRQDVVEACAWRTIIVTADHVQASHQDEIAERRECGRLTPAQEDAARLRAGELNVLITTDPVLNPPRRSGPAS
jgi:hypothetical protein